MPHKCVKCSAVYGDRAGQLLAGCGCGSRIFLFLREDQVSVKEKMESLSRETGDLIEEHQELAQLASASPISIEKAPDGTEDKTAAEIAAELQDFAGWRGEIKREPEEDSSLRAENVRIVEKGSYELDIKSLMAGSPLVIRSQAGVFYIRIPASVQKTRRRKK
ncbi:MAG: Zn-ribbon containing protein [Candidatus Micrarchaeota archaeon]